ncbi:hypothetical protein AVEN_5949-1 [Araneus ventricosus]|uniref:Uncharacterized protein n=1 Tax=Araneus ventricosus TaxID=182803 RepID=A0A4Y2G7P1_ARAVE|nr:hypothetical protein AVEN_5949-1 [Araneus ventricosus]
MNDFWHFLPNEVSFIVTEDLLRNGIAPDLTELALSPFFRKISNEATWVRRRNPRQTTKTETNFSRKEIDDTPLHERRIMDTWHPGQYIETELDFQPNVDGGDGLVVRSRHWGQRVPSSKLDSSEDPSCIGPVVR